MKNSSFAFVVAFILLVSFVTPVVASAQTISYKPQTKGEQVAYLYGRIAQLMAIKTLLDKGNTLQEAVNQSSVDFATGETRSALEVTDTTAVLRGEVTLFGDTTAKAWFEYGVDEDFLDQKTRQVSIRGAYDRAVREVVTKLLDDERYYFRIAVMTGEIVQYGEVYGFRTDEPEDE